MADEENPEDNAEAALRVWERIAAGLEKSSVDADDVKLALDVQEIQYRKAWLKTNNRMLDRQDELRAADEESQAQRDEDRAENNRRHELHRAHVERAEQHWALLEQVWDEARAREANKLSLMAEIRDALQLIAQTGHGG